MIEFLNSPTPSYVAFFVTVVAFMALWSVPLLLGRITKLEKRLGELEKRVTYEACEAKTWAVDTFALKSIEEIDANFAYAETRRLRAELKELNTYTERNIKRIDGELEILNSDVDDLSDTTWEQHVEIERLKLSPLQRWARGVVRGWVE